MRDVAKKPRYFFLLLFLLTLSAAGGVAVLISDGAAREAIARRDFTRALMLRSSSTEALSGKAEILYDRENLAEARSLALAALARSTLDVRALRVLAQTENKAGHADQAQRLMVLAGQLGWRDSRTQAWLFERSVIAGDIVGATQHADALLRRERSTPELFRFIATSASIPEFRAALNSRLADNPPWRVRFFQSTWQYAPSLLPGVALILQDLESTAVPATNQEIAFVTTPMVANGLTAAAHQVWRSIWIARGGGSTLITDGSFEQIRPGEEATQRSPFEWNFPTGSVEAVHLEPAPEGRSGQALRITSGQALPPPFGAQTLVIPAGQYVLSFQTYEEELGAGGNVSLAIRCQNAAQRSLVDQSATSEARGWVSIMIRFSVPSDCGGQTLSIEPTPGQRREGVIWIDDIAIQRVKTSSSASHGTLSNTRSI